MASTMPALPAECPIVELAAGTELWRVHHGDHGPIWFGPAAGGFAGGRFDAPAGEFKTLYVAATLTGAFVETVLRRAARIVARPFVDQRAFSILTTLRPLRLVQLHGQGLIQLGVTGDVCAGDIYAPSQRLALALYEAYELDGIAYRARHNNDEICFALNGRVKAETLEVTRTFSFSDHPAVADDLLRRHGAIWDPMTPISGTK